MTKDQLRLSGHELMKGNFGNAVTALANKSYSSELIQPARYRGGNFFFGVNGQDRAFIWGNYNSSLKAYQDCPVVSAIINKKAMALVNGKRYVMDSTGKESTSPAAKQIKKLLKHPNRIQNGMQFRAQGNVYKQIYGYCPVLVVRPVGFEKDYSKWRLWNIPPWMLQITDNQTDLFYKDGAPMFQTIVLTYMGRSVYLKPEDVFFIRENQISTTTYMSNSSAENSSLFLPDSRLFGLQTPIDNLVSSINSRGVLTRQRGPLWILSNDSTDSGDAGLFPLNPKDKEDMQHDFRQHGIMAEQRRAIITDAKLKLQTVGFDVGQLKLLEGELQDSKMISDGLNFPPYLLGLVDAKFDNQDIAERSLYSNAIIPDAESEDEQYDELFGLDDEEMNLFTDFKHIPALQEDQSKAGAGRKAINDALLIEFLNNITSYNDWRIATGQDPIPKMNDKFYNDLIKEGWVFGTVPNTSVNNIGAAAASANPTPPTTPATPNA